MNIHKARQIQDYYALFGNIEKACLAHSVQLKDYNQFFKDAGVKKPTRDECMNRLKGERVQIALEHAADPKNWQLNVALIRYLDPKFLTYREPPIKAVVQQNATPIQPVKA